MYTDVENEYYVFAENGTYMKLARSKTTNLYTYVIDEESEVLIHSTVAGESNKFSNIDQTRAKAVRKLQELLASSSDYNLVNTVENNAVGSTPFTRKDIRIATAIHGCDVAVLKENQPSSLARCSTPTK